MKKTQDEIVDLLETWLSETIIWLYELEMRVEAEKALIRKMIDMLEELRE